VPSAIQRALDLFDAKKYPLFYDPGRASYL